MLNAGIFWIHALNLSGAHLRIELCKDHLQDLCFYREQEDDPRWRPAILAVEDTIRWLERYDPLTCVYCRRAFTVAENHDRACPYHPDDGAIVKYACCGRPLYDPACCFRPHAAVSASSSSSSSTTKASVEENMRPPPSPLPDLPSLVPPTTGRNCDEYLSTEEVAQLARELLSVQHSPSGPLRRIPTPGAGNCFFYCVSYFLYRTFDRHAQVREQIVDAYSRGLFGIGLAELRTRSNAPQFTERDAGRWIQGLLQTDSRTAKDPAQTARHLLALAVGALHVYMMEWAHAATLALPLRLELYRCDTQGVKYVCTYLSASPDDAIGRILHRGFHFEVLLPVDNPQPPARSAPVAAAHP